MSDPSRFESQAEENAKSPYITAVANFLREQFKKDEKLASDYDANKIELKALWEYIYTAAIDKKIAGSNCVIMTDDEVFGLAIHYIQDGFKEKSRAKVRPAYDSEAEKAKAVALAKKEAAAIRERNEAERLKAKLEKQEAKRKASGQLSIFDFMNEA